MSLDKAIQHGKEHRSPYYRSGKHDRTCRPHGSCQYCAGNRQHRHAKRMIVDDDSPSLRVTNCRPAK